MLAAFYVLCSTVFDPIDQPSHPTGEGLFCHDDPSVACLSEGSPTTVALHPTRPAHLPAFVNRATTLPIPRLCKLASLTTRTRH